MNSTRACARKGLTALTLGSLVVATAAAATPDDPNLTIARSESDWNGYPYAITCDGSPVTPLSERVTAAVPGPGAGALRLGIDAGQYLEYSLELTAPDQGISDLVSYPVTLRSSSGTVRIGAGLDVDGGGTDRWVRLEAGPGTDWTTLDLRTATWEWLTEDSPLPWSFLSEVEGSGTLDEWAAAHGGADPRFAPFLVVMTCDEDTGLVYDVDRSTLDGGTSHHTVDFEPATAPTPVLDRPWATRTITAGDTVTLRTQLTHADGALPVAGRVLGLAWTSSTSSGTASVATDEDGRAAEQVAPLRTTTYSWTFAGDAWFDPASVAELAVRVRSRVSAAVADTRLSRGDRLTVTGRTLPATPGVRVTLWRVTPRGPRALDSGRVTDGGRFRLTERVTGRGRWAVYVTAPASPDNLAGRSPIRRVRISG